MTRRVADSVLAWEAQSGQKEPLATLVKILWHPGWEQQMGGAEVKTFRYCWKRALQRTRAGVPYAGEIPLHALRLRNPSIPERTLQDWAGCGLREMGDMYAGGTMHSFEDLR